MLAGSLHHIMTVRLGISGICALVVILICLLVLNAIWQNNNLFGQIKPKIFSADYSSVTTIKADVAARHEGAEKGNMDKALGRSSNTQIKSPELQKSGMSSANVETSTNATSGGANRNLILAPDLLEELVSNTASAVSKMRFISDQIFPANFSLQYLPEYKSPCWKEQDSLWCLPYFFIPGFPKCGTTELFQKLVAHPEICKGRIKEPHWWTRYRYYDVKSNFGLYKHHFRPAIPLIRKTVDDRGFHPLMLTEASASTIWDNAALYSAGSYEDPTHLNLHAMYAVLPQAKFVVIMRDPVWRLYSDYLYFQEDCSPEEFHEQVNQSISLFRECLQNPAKSFLYCVYASAPRGAAGRDMHSRLRIALYYVHLRVLTCVYPRSNLFVLQLEDYTRNAALWLRKIMRFLDVSNKREEEIEAVIRKNRAANNNKEGYRKAGPMLNETRAMLEEFYRPFNVLLADFLGSKYVRY